MWGQSLGTLCLHSLTPLPTCLHSTLPRQGARKRGSGWNQTRPLSRRPGCPTRGQRPGEVVMGVTSGDKLV